MNIDVIEDGFTAPFSDIVDKNLYDVFKVEGENRWVVRKKEGSKLNPQMKNHSEDIPGRNFL